ncbi:MAG: hypothetical protein Q4G26_11840, partial [Paracoccus sp. (in: a-proteobacteria)]|nr:hypothetical protein [Paracoccus sp. (in: a-proteobacteria)]
MASLPALFRGCQGAGNCFGIWPGGAAAYQCFDDELMGLWQGQHWHGSDLSIKISQNPVGN